MMADVVVLIGNPRAASRTRKLAEAFAQAWLDRLGPSPSDVDVLELAEIVGVSFGPQPVHGNTSGDDPFATVRAARLLIVATPAYKGSYTGLLKVFLDQFGHKELDGVPAVALAVAASPAHAEAAASALGDVLAELGARLVAPPLAVPESRLADGDEIAARWAGQLFEVKEEQ